MKKFTLLKSATVAALLVGSSTLVWALDEDEANEAPSFPAARLSPAPQPNDQTLDQETHTILVTDQYGREPGHPKHGTDMYERKLGQKNYGDPKFHEDPNDPDVEERDPHGRWFHDPLFGTDLYGRALNHPKYGTDMYERRPEQKNYGVPELNLNPEDPNCEERDPHGRWFFDPLFGTDMYGRAPNDPKYGTDMYERKPGQKNYNVPELNWNPEDPNCEERDQHGRFFGDTLFGTDLLGRKPGQKNYGAPELNFDEDDPNAEERDQHGRFFGEHHFGHPLSNIELWLRADPRGRQPENPHFGEPDIGPEENPDEQGRAPEHLNYWNPLPDDQLPDVYGRNPGDLHYGERLPNEKLPDLYGRAPEDVNHGKLLPDSHVGLYKTSLFDTLPPYAQTPLTRSILLDDLEPRNPEDYDAIARAAFEHATKQQYAQLGDPLLWKYNALREDGIIDEIKKVERGPEGEALNPESLLTLLERLDALIDTFLADPKLMPEASPLLKAYILNDLRDGDLSLRDAYGPLVAERRQPILEARIKALDKQLEAVWEDEVWRTETDPIAQLYLLDREFKDLLDQVQDDPHNMDDDSRTRFVEVMTWGSQLGNKQSNRTVSLGGLCAEKLRGV